MGSVRLAIYYLCFKVNKNFQLDDIMQTANFLEILAKDLKKGDKCSAGRHMLCRGEQR
jgi:hypothetical protein